MYDIIIGFVSGKLFSFNVLEISGYYLLSLC